MKRFRRELAFKAHTLWYHSTLGLREISKKFRNHSSGLRVQNVGVNGLLGVECWVLGVGCKVLGVGC